MKLIYVYHSGFILENDNIVVVIDYYKDSGWKGKEGTVHEYLRNTEKRMYILASHAHPDHFNPEIFGWSEKKNLRYILSSDIRKGNKEWEDDVVWLDKGETWQDDFLRIKAYGSTDVGISFLLHTEGKRIFHAGDLNNWHWREESTEQEVEEAEKAFLREVAVLAKDADFLDLAMFPVDPRLGGLYVRRKTIYRSYSGPEICSDAFLGKVCESKCFSGICGESWNGIHCIDTSRHVG